MRRRSTVGGALEMFSLPLPLRRVESFIVSHVGYRYVTALFCCIWRNIVASCHKHFVVFSCNQHHRLLPVMCHNLRHAGCVPPATAFTTPACCRVNTGSQARYRLRIAINAYPPAFDAPISGFHRNIAMPFSMEKLEWCGYPMVKKI